MIRVSGTAKIRVDYCIDLEMTEEQWDALSEKKQNELIDGYADWLDACRDGEIDDIDVDDVVEISGEESA